MKTSEQFSTILNDWLGLFTETFQKSPLTENQITAYSIALSDLSVTELKMACEKTLKTWTFATMPPPGFIREFISDASEGFMGPPQETYPLVTQKEREEALEYSSELKKLLDKKEQELRQTPLKLTYKPIDEAAFEDQLAQYQEWLIAASEQDKFDRSIGLAPVPRSEAERLAIYRSLPLETRRKIAWSKEWTKVGIPTT